MRHVERIAGLDPVRDCAEIMRISMGLEFPWDYTRSLEFALFRTYCVPSISKLLASTGEFERQAQKRYDDTAFLMAEVVEHGYDSGRGRSALRVINRSHGQYPIGNEDMLYVLSTFTFDPITWLEQYGWRPLTAHERLASFHYYSALGARMGIKDVPRSYEEFLAFKETYERTHFVFAETNRQIGQYTMDLFCSWYWYVPRSWTGAAIRSMLTPDMAAAFGFAAPPAWVGRLVRFGLRARARVVRWLPPRRRLRLTTAKNRTYPGYPCGYEPSDLGAISSTARFPSS